MTTELTPIIITPEQIIAAAQLIVDDHDDAWEHTADEYLAATEHWLRLTINNLLCEAGHETGRNGSRFSLSPKCDMPRCQRPALAHSDSCEYHAFHREEAGGATELVMPPVPEWAHEDSSAVELPF